MLQARLWLLEDETTHVFQSWPWHEPHCFKLSSRSPGLTWASWTCNCYLIFASPWPGLLAPQTGHFSDLALAVQVCGLLCHRGKRSLLHPKGDRIGNLEDIPGASHAHLVHVHHENTPAFFLWRQGRKSKNSSIWFFKIVPQPLSLLL